MEDPRPSMIPNVRYNNSKRWINALATRPAVAKTAPANAVGRMPILSLIILDMVHIKNVTPVQVEPTNAEKETKASNSKLSQNKTCMS